MTKLLDLLKSRKRLAEELNARRAAAALAERTVTVCDISAKRIPALLAELRTETFDTPQFSELRAPDDSLVNRDELVFRMEAEAALERLAKDLPAIRSHWDENAKAAA